ncbi:MAG: hypothetical protein AAFU69_14250 [Pseudomonadota bacterium]
MNMQPQHPLTKKEEIEVGDIILFPFPLRRNGSSSDRAPLVNCVAFDICRLGEEIYLELAPAAEGQIKPRPRNAIAVNAKQARKAGLAMETCFLVDQRLRVSARAPGVTSCLRVGSLAKPERMALDAQRARVTALADMSTARRRKRSRAVSLPSTLIGTAYEAFEGAAQ